MRRLALGLLVALSLWAQALTPAEERARLKSQLDQVFARPEFWWKREAPPPPSGPGWHPDLRPLWALIDKLPSLPLEGLMRWMGRLCLVGLAGLLIWLALPVVRRLAELIGAWRQARVPPARAPVELDLMGDPEVLARWQQLAQAARALWSQGQARGAVRAYYLALLANLDEAGSIRYTRGLTNREYARMLGPHHPAAASFSQATGFFELCWYGARDVSPAAFDDYQSVCASILKAAP